MASQILSPLDLLSAATDSGNPQPILVNVEENVTGVLPIDNQAPQNLSGDLSGTTADGNVIKIQGNPVQAVTYGSGQDGQVLTWVNADGLLELKPSSGGSSGSGNIFIYRDSEPSPSGNVYSTFTGAFTAAAALNEPATIIMDNSLNSCSITDAGDYDLHQITLFGFGYASGSGSSLTIYDGVTFNEGVNIVNLGVFTNFETQSFLGTFTGGNVNISVDQYAILAPIDGGSLFDVSTGSATVNAVLNNGSLMVGNSDSSPVFYLGDNSSATVNFHMGNAATTNIALVSGTAGNFNFYVDSPSANMNIGDPFNQLTLANFSGNANFVFTAMQANIVPFISGGAPFTSTPPFVIPTASEGFVYYDTSVNQPFWWTGSAWTSYSPTNTIDNVLVSGSASNGQVLTATSPTTGTWLTPVVPSINFMHGTSSVTQDTHLESGDHIIFDTLLISNGSDITLDTSSSYNSDNSVASVGRITLAPNHTFKLTGNVNQVSGAGNIYFSWRDCGTGILLGRGTRMDDGTGSSDFASHGDCVAYYQTSSTLAVVELYIAFNSGMTSIGENAAAPLLPWFTVEEVL